MRNGQPAVDSGITRHAFIRAPSRLIAACIVTLLPGAVSAADIGLTGDWGGRRSAWSERGVDLDLGYTFEAARNTSGGVRRAGAHAGQLAAAGRFDLERAWGWNGMRAQASLSLRDGDNLADRAALGTLLQSQEVYGRGHIVRLGSLWIGKRSQDGRVDAKAGRLSVGEDFNTLDCIAMHLAFCGSQPAVFAGDHWFNSPLSQWGGVVEFRPAAALYVRAGAYQENPRYADTHGGGLRLAPSGTVGTLTPLELGWEPSFSGRDGRYAVGGWYSSAPRADAVQPGPVASSATDLALRSGAYGGWASAQQQLTHGNGSSDAAGLRAQFAFAQGDRRTGSIDRMLNLQLVYTGPTLARPDDRMGFALGTTWANPRAAQASQADAGGPRARAEHVAEVFYGWRPMAGLELQPGLQYVRHPGGIASRGDVVVAGLKADVRF